MTTGHDDMGRRRRVPPAGGDTGGLCEHLDMAIGYLAKLCDGLGQVTPFGGVPHRGAVQSAVEQLILGAHTSAYRMQFLFG
jgi:hypothetical protein